MIRNLILSGLLVCIFVAGCTPADPQSSQNVNEQPKILLSDLKLLVIGDEVVGGELQRQWAARRDGVVDVQTMTEDQLSTKGYEFVNGFDVVVYPPRMMGEFVSRQKFEQVPEVVLDDDEYLNRKGILRHARTTDSKWANKVWAIPLGSPQFVMIYREDVLAQLGIAVPETWPQFDKMVETLRQAKDLKDEQGVQLPTQVSLPLSEYWLTQMFFARAASSLRSRGQSSVFFSRADQNPMFSNEAYQTALEQFVRLFGEDYDRLSQLTPSDVYRDVLAGGSAVAITWPSVAFLDDSLEANKTEQLGFARLPGADRVFDVSSGQWRDKKEGTGEVGVVGFSGLVASVCANSGNLMSAREFVKWAASKQVANSVLVQSKSTGPFRASQLGAADRWIGDFFTLDALEQFGNAVRGLNDGTIVVVFPRVPGQRELIDTIDSELRQAMAGAPVAQSLQNIVANLQTIIERNGGEGEFKKWLRMSQQY